MEEREISALTLYANSFWKFYSRNVVFFGFSVFDDRYSLEELGGRGKEDERIWFVRRIDRSTRKFRVRFSAGLIYDFARFLSRFPTDREIFSCETRIAGIPEFDVCAHRRSFRNRIIFARVIKTISRRDESFSLVTVVERSRNAICIRNARRISALGEQRCIKRA